MKNKVRYKIVDVCMIERDQHFEFCNIADIIEFEIHLSFIELLFSQQNITATREYLFEQRFFYREYAPPYHKHFRQCSSPIALTSNIIFKKCGVNTSLGIEYYILKFYLHLAFPKMSNGKLCV